MKAKSMFGLGKKKCPVCQTKEVKGSGVEVKGEWYCSQAHLKLSQPVQVPANPLTQAVPAPSSTAPAVKKIPVEY